jgi:hypothetical protein
MYSFASAPIWPPTAHRRGGPIHVRVLLSELEANLAEGSLATREHGPMEVDPDATVSRPVASTPYPRVA